MDVAARTARHGHLTLHLPEGWRREHEWTTLFTHLRAASRRGLTRADRVALRTAGPATGPPDDQEPRASCTTR
jgi:hypothetical protein